MAHEGCLRHRKREKAGVIIEHAEDVARFKAPARETEGSVWLTGQDRKENGGGGGGHDGR